MRKPFLPGESDMDQLKQILTVLGTPTDEEWPGHKSLPDYVNVGVESQGQNWVPWIMSVGKIGVELIREMLRYDPLRRISAMAVRGSILVLVWLTKLKPYTRRFLIGPAPSILPQRTQANSTYQATQTYIRTCP
jgi:hypothetical protein